MPGDSGSISTLKPGLGVAQSTSTPEAEKEIAAVPPMRVKVWVVAAGGGGVVGAGVGGGVVGAGCVVGAGWLVGAGCVVGAVVGLGVGWIVGFGVGADGVACVDGLESLPSALPGVSAGSFVGVEPGSLAVAGGLSLFSLLGLAASLGVGEASSAADGGSTTWLSTTDTPAQATPTAAALAVSHIENSISFFMQSVSPIGW